MRYKEIANKITGISCPVFGLSWKPPMLESEIAKKVVIYLEDRRVLYNHYELEMPKHCYESVVEIRKFLTERLFEVGFESELGKIIRGMRAECRKFLDSIPVEELEHRSNNSFEMKFFSGIGELRGTIGIFLAKVLVMYGIDCEENLIAILPIDDGS